MRPAALSTGYRAEVAETNRAKTASTDTLSESALSRLFVGALWTVFAIFICVLLSFHEPLRASTADILLVLILVAGVVGLLL